MSLLSRLFGGKGQSSDPVGEDYGGFHIVPVPMPEGKQFRLSARIDGQIDGVQKSHTVIRADMFESLEAANTAAITKAKQVIDEQGAQLFR